MTDDEFAILEAHIKAGKPLMIGDGKMLLAELRAAREEIGNLQHDVTRLTQANADMATEIARLRRALRPFAFTAAPYEFAAYEDGGVTECLVCDKDVQTVREVLGLE